MKKINSNKIDEKIFSSGIVHFCGIGGIGMSAIAQVMHQNGIKVQGSDSSESYMVQNMRNLGIKIFPAQKESNLQGVSCLVYSSAINLDTNEEVLAAKKAEIPIIHRSIALGFVMQGYKSIAVSGSHGKTTTTSLLGLILDKCGIDPVIISGGIMNEYNSNYKIGKGKYIVVEADESDGSFVNFNADLSIITNIDREHMDHYKTMDKVEEVFKVLLDHSKTSVICSDDERLVRLSSGNNVIKYGFKNGADLQIIKESIVYENGYSFFDISCDNEKFTIKTKLFGLHNFLNICSAFLIAKNIGCKVEDIISAISLFSGVKRRFTQVGKAEDTIVIDDYAHHPTEIKAVIQSAKDFMKISKRSGEIVVIFQPHRYSRMYDLMDDFAACFDGVDKIILNPIYSAGETNENGVKIDDLAKKIQKNNKNLDIRICALDNVKANLGIMNVTQNDIIIFMGAGDISKFAYSSCDVLF